MKKNSVYTQELIDQILKIQACKKPLRKATVSDLFSTPSNVKVNTEKKLNSNDRIKSFRKQEEFGPKKRIKPWRTSCKSQQQIVPKGHKKGFRGNSVTSTNFFKNQAKQV